MPRYDYKCNECGVFEVNQSIHDNRLKTCPDCERPIIRLVSSVSFTIKGASAANGYSIPPTNEALGLPSERSLMKNLKENEYYVQESQLGRPLTQQEKEVVNSEQKQKEDEAGLERKRIEDLKEKHPEFTGKVQDAIEKEKSLPTYTKKKRKDKREHGTRQATKKDLKGVHVPETSKIFKE